MIGNDLTGEVKMTVSPKPISPFGNYGGVCGVYSAALCDVVERRS